MKIFVILPLMLSISISCGKQDNKDQFRKIKLNTKASALIKSDDVDGDGIKNDIDPSPYIANIPEAQFEFYDDEDLIISKKFQIISNNVNSLLIDYLRNSKKPTKNLQLGYKIPRYYRDRILKLHGNNQNVSFQIASKNLSLYNFNNVNGLKIIDSIPKLLKDSFFVKVNDYKLEDEYYKKKLQNIKKNCYEYIFIDTNHTPFRIKRLYISKVLKLTEIDQKTNQLQLFDKDHIDFNKYHFDTLGKNRNYSTLLNVDLENLQYLPNSTQIIHIKGKRSQLSHKAVTKSFHKDLKENQAFKIDIGNVSFFKLNTVANFKKHEINRNEIQLKKTYDNVLGRGSITVMCNTYHYQPGRLIEARLELNQKHLQLSIQGKNYSLKELVKGVHFNNSLKKNLNIKILKLPQQNVVTGFIPLKKKRKCGKRSSNFKEFTYKGKSYQMKHKKTLYKYPINIKLTMESLLL